MAFTPSQQLHHLLEEKKHILITFRKDPSGDTIASSLALFLFLKKMGKRADIVSHNFRLPKTLGFLKHASSIQPQFSHLQKFILTVDVAESGVQELSYDVKENKLRVFITPRQGFLTKEHIRTAQSDFKYDLIICVDTPDLTSLGALYENNTELFYKTPMVNIDHAPQNEHFGQINFVELTATSTAEVMYDVLSQLAPEQIDEDLATTLLTGLIAKTHSFKTEQVKPTTLNIASKLVSLGADRDNIVQHLYRTRTVATLKLWGQALAHLQTIPSLGLVYTTITREDFTRSGADEEDLYDIVEELIANSPEARLVLLLHEHAEANAEKHTIHGYLKSIKYGNAKALIKPFQPDGNDQHASFTLHDLSLKQAEETLIKHLSEQIQSN